MNRRNVEYMLPLNPREYFPRVDDKLITKEICESRGIPVPQTYAVLHRQSHVRWFSKLVKELDEFVIKPTRGSLGRGILIVTECYGRDRFILTGNQDVHVNDIRYRLSEIIAGLYSLNGHRDRVIVEQRIAKHPVFDHVAGEGTPDVRVIVYRGAPAMAMVRLPTEESRGRANLHQGAVAAGIDLDSGITFGGVCKSRCIDFHPDTRHPLAGITVPYWNDLLAAAIRLAQSLELGLVGIDFVIDPLRGPVVLEANARPGLAIQVANRNGLVCRFQEIDKLPEGNRPTGAAFVLNDAQARSACLPKRSNPS